jgi:hypothetical protein
MTTEKTRVADFLTSEQIERVLSADYMLIDGDEWKQIRQRGTSCCPLEVALGFEKTTDRCRPVMEAFGVVASDDDALPWDHPLMKFMRDVDLGIVTTENLREALGVVDA